MDLDFEAGARYVADVTGQTKYFHPLAHSECVPVTTCVDGCFYFSLHASKNASWMQVKQAYFLEFLSSGSVANEATKNPQVLYF
jgi:hypothetical protein